MTETRPLIFFDRNLSGSQKIFLCSIICSIGLGKWGAWIGFPQQGIFLIDLLFFFSVIKFSLINQTKPKYSRVISILCIYFVIFQIIRTSENNFNLVLRDLIPFVYLAAIPLIIDILRSFPLVNIISAIRAGVILSLIWSIPVWIGILKPIILPSQFFGVPIFTHRYDLTGIVLAIGIIVFGNFKNCQLRKSPTLISFCVIFGFFQSSRAATIAVLLAIAVVSVKTDKQKIGKFFVILPLILAALAMILLIFPSQFQASLSGTAVERFGVLGQDSAASIGASNTSAARLRAADKLLKWFHTREQRFLGVGPGTEMVILSGAISDLSGSIEVRAPHNWFVGLYVRFGILGSILWIYVVIRSVIYISKSDSWKWRAIVLIISIVSALGVIIESPFGSLPLVLFVSLSYLEKGVMSK